MKLRSEILTKVVRTEKDQVAAAISQSGREYS
jgi:hypothetical protein